MKIARNDAQRTHAHGIAGVSPLTEQDLRAVAGGKVYAAYYDATTGHYLMVVKGEVHIGGMYVGDYVFLD